MLVQKPSNGIAVAPGAAQVVDRASAKPLSLYAFRDLDVRKVGGSGAYHLWWPEENAVIRKVKVLNGWSFGPWGDVRNRIDECFDASKMQ